MIGGLSIVFHHIQTGGDVRESNFFFYRMPPAFSTLSGSNSMKRKTLVLTLLALLLIFALAACGGEKGEETAATPASTATSETQSSDAGAAKVEPTATPVPPTPTPEPTATPVPPTPTPEPKEEMASQFARIEDVVNSYHSVGEFIYEITTKPADDTDSANIHFVMESDWVKADNPYGYNIATTISGFDLSQSENGEDIPQDMQMVLVDDTSYIKFGDQWVSASRSDVGEEDTLSINIDDFISDMDEVEKVGKETINGIKTIHYRYKDTSSFKDTLNDILSSQLGEDEDLTQFKAVGTQTSGDIWIAEKGQYAVKVEINMETTFKGEDKEVHIKGSSLMEISDVNGDITVEPPEDAPKPGQANVPGFEPGAFPIPEQTTVDGSFGGMVNLSSQLSVDEVNAFYQEELTKLGWTSEGDMMPTWTKDGQSFMLMVTPNDDNTTTILIMVNPEQ